MENNQFEFILDYVNQAILKLFQWSPSYQDINLFVITKSLNQEYKVKELSTDIIKATQRFSDLNIQLNHDDKQFLQNNLNLINDEIMKGESNIPFVQQYINFSKPAHVQLSFKMKERGIPIQIGSRMEYVVIEHLDDISNKGKLQNKFEDPSYFCQFSDLLRLDRLYYLKSLVQCVDQVLETAFKQTPIDKLNKYHIAHRKIMMQIQNISKSKIIISD